MGRSGRATSRPAHTRQARVTTPDQTSGRFAATRRHRGAALLCACLFGAPALPVLAMQPLPKILWTQLDIYDEDVAARAEAAGIKVVMNRCPKIEIPRLAASRG